MAIRYEYRCFMKDTATDIITFIGKKKLSNIYDGEIGVKEFANGRIGYVYFHIGKDEAGKIIYVGDGIGQGGFMQFDDNGFSCEEYKMKLKRSISENIGRHTIIHPSKDAAFKMKVKYAVAQSWLFNAIESPELHGKICDVLIHKKKFSDVNLTAKDLTFIEA